jgi:hypothetical protein
MVPLAAHPRTTRLSYRNAIGSLAPSELRGYGRAKAPQLRTPREELKYMDNTIDGCTKPRKPIDHTATLSEIVLRGHRSGASR